MKHLIPKDELAFLKEIHGGDIAKVFHQLHESFGLLQARSQMLLGLATICLTITGFSGPRMASANAYSRVFIGAGLLFVLLSVISVVCGPLRLRWITSWKAESMDATLIAHLERRNMKTRFYKLATAFLMIGLSCYFCSVVYFLSVVE